MSSDESRPFRSSPLVAILALLVLSGLLMAPCTFIFYGAAGGALGGLMLLAILISCQSVVYVIMKYLWKKLR